MTTVLTFKAFDFFIKCRQITASAKNNCFFRGFVLSLSKKPVIFIKLKCNNMFINIMKDYSGKLNTTGLSFFPRFFIIT